MPLLEKIKLVGEAGYGGIELWLNDVWDFVARGGEVSDVTRAVEDQGLIVPSVIAMRAMGDFKVGNINWCLMKPEGVLPWVQDWVHHLSWLPPAGKP